MTVLFDIRGAKWPQDEDGVRSPPAELYLNISNSNARDFLNWVGLHQHELWGEMPARELAALLRRRLWPERRNRDDEGRDGFIEREARGALFLSCGRNPGKLASYAERLLRLAEYAGDGMVVWY